MASRCSLLGRLILKKEWHNNLYILLKENDIAVFTIKAVKSFEEEEEQFYVVADPQGMRLLLPFNQFINYKLNVGQALRCRVDKVNCNGRLFLEPEHPFYEVDKRYSFPIVRRVSVPDANQQLVIVADCYQNPIFLLLNRDEEEAKTSVEKVVIKTSKGEVCFAPQKAAPKVPQWLKFHQVEVVGKKSLSLFTDEKGDLHKVEIGKFKGVDVSKSQWFSAEGFTNTGEIRWEPQHPYYKLGECYPFFYQKIIERFDIMRGMKKLALLNDEHGDAYELLLNRPQNSYTHLKAKKGDVLQCEVEKIKYGKVYLKLAKR